MPDRYTFILAHDPLDGWPFPFREFDRAWEARAALGRVLRAQPGSVGIIARWDDDLKAWVKMPSFAGGMSAREWWERQATRP